MTRNELLRLLSFQVRGLRGRITSFFVGVKAWCRFWHSRHAYQQLASAQGIHPVMYLYPCLGDDTNETPVDATYFYQDAWAFEKIIQQRPAEHIDAGSHHKFVALLSKVIPVTMVDIRPLPTPLNTLNFRSGSILQMPYPDASVYSVSSLCVVEHIGLGRYGDALNPRGTEEAMEELKRIVAPGGSLYISLPIDNDNIIFFNAHRAFSEEYFLSLCNPFDVLERRYIYGYEFVTERRPGFGTGCYHLQRPL